jgi:hypothetical protein
LSRMWQKSETQLICQIQRTRSDGGILLFGKVRVLPNFGTLPVLIRSVNLRSCYFLMLWIGRAWSFLCMMDLTGWSRRSLLGLVLRETRFCAGISLKEILEAGRAKDGGSFRLIKLKTCSTMRNFFILTILISINSILGFIRFTKCFKGVSSYGWSTKAPRD